MSLESSSPIRSLRVASRDESEEREYRCQTKGRRCPCALMIDWKLGVASIDERESSSDFIHKVNYPSASETETERVDPGVASIPARRKDQRSRFENDAVFNGE